MLTNCPECELNVSDKAITCPHCGYPLNQNAVKRAYTKRKGHKRLPNGFGNITEIKNRNLRKPFRAMVCVGKTTEGKPICKLLKPEAYFKTYNDAYQALWEYNKNPYDLDDSITVKELYERWTEEYFPTLKSTSSQRTIKSAWSYCSSIYDMRAKDVRSHHIKGCMDHGVIEYKGQIKSPTDGVKARIKSMFNLMMDYAYEHDIVVKNYARSFDISDTILDNIEQAKRSHISFTEKEMEILWDNVNKKQYVDILLIQCYSGWRPQELGLIELKNVDLNNWTFVGGMKTNAGKNRVVPIHHAIRHLVVARYKEAESMGSNYLFNCADATTHRSNIKLTYDKYQKSFTKIIQELNLNPDHRAHDPRHHFVTIAKKYNVDEYAIKYIIGHKIADLTESTYTDRDIEWLKSEIEKIK